MQSTPTENVPIAAALSFRRFGCDIMTQEQKFRFDGFLPLYPRLLAPSPVTWICSILRLLFGVQIVFSGLCRLLFYSISTTSELASGGSSGTCFLLLCELLLVLLLSSEPLPELALVAGAVATVYRRHLPWLFQCGLLPH